LDSYINKAIDLKLYNNRYWHLLLHMDNNISEIDDANFFFSKDGAINPKSELISTLKAFYSDINSSDENSSSICRFPARYYWLKEKLDFPSSSLECKEYQKILKRVDPQSVTLVFPSAHINSPASMFGHTFLRINSSYNSRLLSYAINYAANADTKKENGVVFAIKGLIGGYYGLYSLLPYYDKLKEYRDTEQRDIWEYDLNLTPKETLKMFRHIWELKDTNSFYYFFTENCSYNMLWLLEIARDKLYLRDKFTYQVIPLETVYIIKNAGLIKKNSYRPSKRAVLLKYEKLIDKSYIDIPKKLNSKSKIYLFLDNQNISLEQKKYILEASVELLEYRYIKGQIKKDKYLTLFHQLTMARATLGQSSPISIKTPENPLKGHRAVRLEIGYKNKNKDSMALLGIRPAYHSIDDPQIGFMRGTQIEFLDILLSKSKDKFRLEKGTILSIISISQRDDFFKPLSWRTKFEFNRYNPNGKLEFLSTVGAGYSWGNNFGYLYTLVDPFYYSNNDYGIDSSIGINIDKFNLFNINMEFARKFYNNSNTQNIMNISTGVNISNNKQLLFKYNYNSNIKNKTQDSSTIIFKYFF